MSMLRILIKTCPCVYIYLAIRSCSKMLCFFCKECNIFLTGINCISLFCLNNEVHGIQFSFDCVIQFIVFQFPNVLAEFCAVSFLL